MSWTVKLDSNHKALTAFLRSIGWWFLDTARFRGFGADLLTRHKDGYPLLIEIKPEGKLTESSFTDSEKQMRTAFPEFWRVAQTVEQLAEAIGFQK
jgi:hypothetical protein